MSVFEKIRNQSLCMYHETAYRFYIEMQKKHISDKSDKMFKIYARKALDHLKKWTELLKQR